MIKKTAICGLILILGACDQQQNVQALAPSSSDNTSQYSPEELLGKTVEEFEQLEKENKNSAAEQKKPPKEIIKNGYLQLNWEALIAPGYDADSILAKYEPQIAKLQHGGEGAVELYQKMQAEFDNAPANQSLAEKEVSIPGFIAPLEQRNGIITEFLLVPYFGACIHMPAPPANQTVYVKTARDYGIKIGDAYQPIWVSGEILIENESTEIGAASYQIHEALISPYSQ